MKKTIIILGLLLLAVFQIFAQDTPKNTEEIEVTVEIENDTIKDIDVRTIEKVEEEVEVTVETDGETIKDIDVETIEKKKGDEKEVIVTVDTENDTIKDIDIKINVPPLSKKNKKLKRTTIDHFSVDFGLNIIHIDGNPNIVSNELSNNIWRSKALNVNLVTVKHNFAKHHMNIAWGIKWDLDRFYLENKYTLQKNDHVEFVDLGNVDKSFLITNYLAIPLSLNYISSPKNSSSAFRIGAGGYIGILTGAHTKYKGGDYSKTKVFNSFNLNKVNYGLTANIGYGNFLLFVDYNLNDMFVDHCESCKETTPQGKVMSIGIRITD